MLKFIKGQRTWIYVVSILVIVFLLFVPPFSVGIKKFSLKLLLIPVKAFSGTAEYFRSKRDLQDENAVLRKESGELSIKIGQYEELQGENQRLRELLRFKKSVGFDTISAEVVARNPNEWVGSFVIDKGADDGIQKNMAVCSSNGLLGKIVESHRKTSTVMLITHPGFRTGGMLRDSRINGVVVGSGKDTVKMLYIPIDAEVGKGETVITSGFSRIFPKGLLIGEVMSVEKSKTGLYKNAIIKPSAESFNQEEVLCIK
ncbi:rod shape-determining protein MreC [Candidatus Omnitrophota bacterium]